MNCCSLKSSAVKGFVFLRMLFYSVAIGCELTFNEPNLNYPSSSLATLDSNQHILPFK